MSTNDDGKGVKTQTAAGQGAATGGERPQKPPNRSFCARFWVVVFLIAWTVPLTYAGKYSIEKLEKRSTEESKQVWTAGTGVTLDVGPESFLYDADKHELIHRGLITKSQQEELRGLIQLSDSVPEAERSALKKAYGSVIDRLAYESRKKASDILMWLLLVGGVFGAAGTVARMYGNFLQIACYERGRDFDLWIWWPYYVVLPVLGFIMGVFVTVLLKANLLSIENQSPSGNLWWAGISIIVGFGALDVSERIKAVGKGMFGSAKPKKVDPSPKREGQDGRS